MLADRQERASRLRQAIKDRGFSSLREAADRHHYTLSTLTHHTNGTRPFDLETGYAYAQAFKVDPVWLLGLSDDRASTPTIDVEMIRGMMESSMRELPLAATVEDYLRVVPLGLRERLERYLAGAEFPDTPGGASGHGTDAPPPAPTN